MHYFNWYVNVANKLEKGCPEAEGTNTGQFLAVGTSHPYREKKTTKEHQQFNTGSPKTLLNIDKIILCPFVENGGV